MSKKNNDNSSNNSRANTKEKISDDNSDSLVMEKGKKKSKKGSSKSIDEEEEDYLKLNCSKNAQTNKKVRRPRNSLVLYKDQLKFKKTKNGYDAYRINIQDRKGLIYLFSTDNISNIKYYNNYVYYIDNDKLKVFGDLVGVNSRVISKDLIIFI